MDGLPRAVLILRPISITTESSFAVDVPSGACADSARWRACVGEPPQDRASHRGSSPAICAPDPRVFSRACCRTGCSPATRRHCCKQRSRNSKRDRDVQPGVDPGADNARHAGRCREVAGQLAVAWLVDEVAKAPASACANQGLRRVNLRKRKGCKKWESGSASWGSPGLHERGGHVPGRASQAAAAAAWRRWRSSSDRSAPGMASGTTCVVCQTWTT